MTVKKKILIVDDEPAICRLFNSWFTEEGYNTYEIGDGREALRFMRDHKDISLIILDIFMPPTSGVKVFEAIKKEFPASKVIISSVCPPPDQKFLICGADDYYYKSDSISVLVDKVNKILNNNS